MPEFKCDTGIYFVHPTLRELVENKDSNEVYLVEATRMMKVLLVAGTPAGQVALRLAAEQNAIAEGLNKASCDCATDLRLLLGLDGGNVSNAIREYQPDIVHIATHGTPDGSILFEGHGQGEQKCQFADVLNASSHYAKCVLINVCYAGKLAEQVNKNCNVVISSDKQLDDDDCVAFARTFYSSLAIGSTVHGAFESAEESLTRDKGLRSLIVNRDKGEPRPLCPKQGGAHRRFYRALAALMIASIIGLSIALLAVLSPGSIVVEPDATALFRSDSPVDPEVWSVSVTSGAAALWTNTSVTVHNAFAASATSVPTGAYVIANELLDNIPLVATINVPGTVQNLRITGHGLDKPLMDAVSSGEASATIDYSHAADANNAGKSRSVTIRLNFTVRASFGWRLRALIRKTTTWWSL